MPEMHLMWTIYENKKRIQKLKKHEIQGIFIIKYIDNISFKICY